MSNNFEKIDEFRCDVLREIGNIGSGNAANSLSSMIDSSVEVSLPVMKVLDVNEAANMLGGPEKISVGIFSEVKGDIKGLIMLIIDLCLADKLLTQFVDEKTNVDGVFSPMQLSALSEIGNIMSSSYASSVSSLFQVSVNVSVPHICVDMVGAILSIPSIQFSEFSDKIVLIENQFKNIALNYGANIFLIPDVDSFEKLINRLL